MNFVAMCIGGPYHGRAVSVLWSAGESGRLTVDECSPLERVGVAPVVTRHTYHLEQRGRSYYWIHDVQSHEVDHLSGLVREQVDADKNADQITHEWCDRHGGRWSVDRQQFEWRVNGCPVAWMPRPSRVVVGGYALEKLPTTYELAAILDVLAAKGGAS